MKRHSITDEWDGARLDRFVRAVCGGISFPAVQQMIRKKRVLLNGTAADGKARLSAGDSVEIDFIETEKTGSRPDGERDTGITERFGRIGDRIPVIYEDDHVVVIDKPPGLPVQPGNEKEKGSLLDLLAEYSGKKDGRSAGTPGGFTPTPVHRLDAGTSGALLIAKTRTAARKLSGFIRDRRLTKLYLAVVEGIPDPKEGKISGAISTEKGARSRSSIDRNGKKAETYYAVKKVLPGKRSLLELRITSGRTHQIRVHLSSIGCPVEGDGVYGSGSGKKRLMLHAWKISFPDPYGDRTIDVTAPVPSIFVE